MRTLYLECNMGASADMLMGALLELKPNKHVFLKQISSIGLPGVSVKWRSAERCGIWGSQIVVLINGVKEGFPNHSSPFYVARPYLSYTEVLSLITKLYLPQDVQEDIIDIYTIIASALAQTNRIPLEQVQLYEAGSISSITNVIGCCMLINQLKVSNIVASAIHVGYGNVKKLNGTYPVPTPAVANILKDVPTFGGEIEGELCTLTGAAILKHYVQDFTGMPIMQVEKIGYGIGEQDYPIANCIRAFLGSLANRPSMDKFSGLYCEIQDRTTYTQDDYIMKKGL